MDVDNVKNDSVVTLIPIHDMLKGKQPGAYVLIAIDAAKGQDSQSADDDYSGGADGAAQWVVDCDIALTTFQGGQSGLTVFARSYASAKPLSRREAHPAWRATTTISPPVTTDGSGRADFDAGLMNGNRRRRAGGGDGLWPGRRFQLPRSAPLGLRPDRPRRRRPRQCPARWTPISIPSAASIAPARRVQATAMLRDRVGAAIDRADDAGRAHGPMAWKFARITVAGAALVAGTASWTLPLGNTAPHGRWQIAAYHRSQGARRSAACSSTSPISCRSD